MTMIKNVVFDFGGVLVDWNRRYLYDKYFGDVEKSKWFLDNVCTLEWNNDLDWGMPFAESVKKQSALFPEYADAIEAFDSRWLETIGGDIPGMYEYVKELKGRGVPLYGLTNWSTEKFNLIRGVYPVFGLLEGMVVSGEEHLLKPHPEIYRCLLDRYGLKAEESLFIDDNEANVQGALAVGMKGLRFCGERLLRIDLNLLVDTLRNNPL